MCSSENHTSCPCDLVPFDSVNSAQLQPVNFLRKQVLVLLPPPFVMLDIPRMRYPSRRLPGSQLLPDQVHMVCPAATDGFGSGEYRPLPTDALHHDALGTPHIVLSVRGLLHLIVTLGALDYGRHPATPFPHRMHLIDSIYDTSVAIYATTRAKPRQHHIRPFNNS